MLASMYTKQQQLDVGFNLSQAARRKDRKKPARRLRNNVICSCRCQPQTSRSQFRSYGYNLSGFWDRTTQHLPDCPQYRYSQRTDTLGAKYTYCTKALGYSVAVFMSLRTGAGGFSINPQLTFRAVVPWSSPAFQLFESQEFRRKSETRIRFSCSLDHANWILEQLYALFQAGTASPTDVLSDGSTFLHVCKPPNFLLEKYLFSQDVLPNQRN